MALAMVSATPCVKIGSSSFVSVVTRTASSRCLLHSSSALNLVHTYSSALLETSSSSVSSWREWHRAGNMTTDIRNRDVRVQASLVTETSDVPKIEIREWTWKFEGKPIKIHFQEYVLEGADPVETILMLPTLSDVSTTAEWQAVAEGLLTKASKYRIVVVDWPGLGFSERPSINYTADALEQFLTDFVTAADGPLGTSQGGSPVIIGGGHAATIAARALSKDLIQAQALIAVAPTWAGPMPIVFGRTPTMEFRYKLLRDTLRSQGVGWAMYKYLVSSPKNIKMQYLTHVYADADNVTPAIVDDRTALTQRDGARYAPAAFLTGLLDPTNSREELLEVFAKLDGKVPTLVLSTIKSPRRSRAEMEALEGVKGVTKFSKVPGALLPQEEYPEYVTDELLAFLQQ